MGPFLTGLSSWELGIQAFLFLNPRQAMAGEAFARHAECTRDYHVPLNTATAEGPLGSALLLTDQAKELPRAAEKHLCFPSSCLQNLGAQPRPTLTFPSQASRKAMFPGIKFAFRLHTVCGPHLDQCVVQIWMSTSWWRQGGGCSCEIEGEPAWQHGLQALLQGHLLCSLPGFCWP